MDPDATLAEIRRLVQVKVLSPQEASRLQDLAEALDDWIAAGGFLPAAWRTTEGWGS